MSRRRVRLGQVRVYKSGRVIRLMPQKQAYEAIFQKRAVEIFTNGVFMGISFVQHQREIAAVQHARKSEAKAQAYSVLNDPDARRSCVVLTRAEAEAVAERRPSRTEGMSFDDPRRDARVVAGLPEMDLAEAARVKFKAMFGGMLHRTGEVAC